MALASLASCGGAEDDAPPAVAARVIRQSVEPSRALELRAVWRVGHQGDAAAVDLFLVLDAALTRDDHAIILEGGNHRVDVIDPAGRLVRQFGGEGEGPNEFSGTRGFALRGDTILVGDRANRVHFFDTYGTPLGTYRLRFPDEEVNSLGHVAAAPEGWLVTARGYFRGRGTELAPLHREWAYTLDPATGDVEDAGLRWQHAGEGRFSGIFWVQPILVHRPVGAFDGLGRFIVADTASYRVDVYRFDGRHLLRVENKAERRPIDDRMIELWEGYRRCPAGAPAGMECSTQRDEMARAMPRTRHRPFVDRLRAHSGGHFSVLRADLDPNPFDSEGRSEYDHFAPDGTYVGRTSGLIPLWFDGNDLLALERDELGVESVVRYAVVDASGS